MSDILIKEVDLEEAFKVHQNVMEFQAADLKKEYFEERYKDCEKLIIVAYYENIPVGYIIGYDRYHDNSFYCWLAGVDNQYRRLGALTKLMQYQKEWAKKKGYEKLKIKTRNNKREMLSFLVKNNFYITSIEPKENIEENRINLEILL